MDHLKKFHTNPETENRDGNSDLDTDSWELPSSTPSNTPENTDSGDAARNSDPGIEPDPSDELPNTSENEADKAEASLGTSIRRYPSRAHHPPRLVQSANFWGIGLHHLSLFELFTL